MAAQFSSRRSQNDAVRIRAIKRRLGLQLEHKQVIIPKAPQQLVRISFTGTLTERVALQNLVKAVCGFLFNPVSQG
jgi:hypothetical protein